MAMYGYVGLCMAVYGQDKCFIINRAPTDTWLCRAMYVGLCRTGYGYVGLCRAM